MSIKYDFDEKFSKHKSEVKQTPSERPNPIEQRNPALTFATILASVTVVAMFIVLMVFGWIAAFYVLISGFITCAVLFLYAALIERQNKIIELIQETNRILSE